MIKHDALYIGYYYFVIKKADNTEERFDLIEEFNQDIFSDMEKVLEKLKQKINIGKVDIDESTIYLELLLKIERLQSETTHMESINVSINPQLGGKPQVLKCNLMNMNTVLSNLILYGTGLMKNDIPKLVNVIQTKYRFLKVEIDKNEDTLENDEKYMEIITMFKDVIDKAEEDILVQTTEEKTKRDNKDGIKPHTFTITVNEFKEYIETTEYVKYGISTIREKFMKDKITICNTGRTDYTEKRGKDTVKVIKFNVDKMKEKIDKYNSRIKENNE
jgi:hypothetical protein